MHLIPFKPTIITGRATLLEATAPHSVAVYEFGALDASRPAVQQTTITSCQVDGEEQLYLPIAVGLALNRIQAAQKLPDPLFYARRTHSIRLVVVPPGDVREPYELGLLCLARVLTESERRARWGNS